LANSSKKPSTVAASRPSGQVAGGIAAIFGLDLAEQEETRFRADYAVYQVEYSRNLLFRRGDQMEEVFQGLVDRDRAPGPAGDPHHLRQWPARRLPRRLVAGLARARRATYSLTVFKLHFGWLTKRTPRASRVLRFEAIAHNTRELHCGRIISKFGEVGARLRAILERALGILRGMDLRQRRRARRAVAAEHGGQDASSTSAGRGRPRC